MTLRTAVDLAALAICICLTVWVWLLPLGLPVARDWGDTQASLQASRAIAADTASNKAVGKAVSTAEKVRAWREHNPGQFERWSEKASQRFRDAHTYTGPDGRERVYLGDVDSYYWLHLARNLLRTGEICTPSIDDRCLDMQANAPVGAPVAYPYSLHVYAIAAIQRLITAVCSHFPLSQSAKLVPVIIAALGVIPAFFIGRQLAGAIGGMVAAIAIFLNPLLLQRALGGDNDIWNLVLPLYMVWAAIAALEGNYRHRIFFAALAGCIATLHATLWQGWVFTYLVVLGSLAGCWVITAAAHWPDTHGRRVRTLGAGGMAAVTIAIFYAASGLGAYLVGAGQGYLAVPLHAVEKLAGRLFGLHSVVNSGEMDWPNAMRTVGELNRLDLGALVDLLGGAPLMLLALTGLLLVFFPYGQWQRRHYVLLTTSIGAYIFGLLPESLDGVASIGVFAAPPLIAALMRIGERRAASATDGAALILLVWFVAALIMSTNGLRYMFLAGPPFGLALAAFVGRVHDRLKTFFSGRDYRLRVIANAGGLLLMTLVLVNPVQSGLAAAHGYAPLMNDAWWQTLAWIRDNGDPDSIVTVWWDSGHWSKYVADRRVTVDGTALRTHLPYWVGRALATPNPGESVGILRMLDCASEATPLPESRLGAYGRLRSAGYDEVDAYTIVAGLTRRDRVTADTWLARHGVPAPDRPAILGASHCDPPPAYLVLSTTLLQKLDGWFRLGMHDPLSRALVSRIGSLSRPEASAWLQNTYGYDAAQAKSLLEMSDKSKASKGADGSGHHRDALFVDRAWRPCTPADADAEVTCPVQLRSKGRRVAASLRYQAADPAGTWELVADATSASGNPERFMPGLLLLADDDGLKPVETAAASHPESGILLDVVNARVLTGTPDVLRSTLVQLLSLDGRYTPQYEKLDERTAYSGERVSLWRVNWKAADRVTEAH